MTIKIPPPSVGDRILAAFGKKRAVKIPADIYDKFGPYVYAGAQKESFWRALLRPRGRKPPDGFFYPEDVLSTDNDGGLNERNIQPERSRANKDQNQDGIEGTGR
jgi:hypothetical protein